MSDFNSLHIQMCSSSVSRSHTSLKYCKTDNTCQTLTKNTLTYMAKQTIIIHLCQKNTLALMYISSLTW